MYLKQLEKYGGFFVFKCNMNKADAKFMKIKFQFLKEIIEALCTINFDVLRIQKSEEVLWNNTSIKLNKQGSFFIKNGSKKVYII